MSAQRQPFGTWDVGAVKHRSVFPGSVRFVSFFPLYRLASFHGQLPEEERFLKTVSRYIDGDESRGKALERHINWPTAEDQIMKYIERYKGDISI